MALFVLAFLRAHAEQEGVKATEKEIQENLGNMLLAKSCILPLEMEIFTVARDTELNQLFRKVFSLPEPEMLINILNEKQISQADTYLCRWYETWIKNERRCNG